MRSPAYEEGIDFCLHLIRRDFGSAAANTRARGLVAPPQRQGSQAQFIERLMPDASGDQLGPFATGCSKTLRFRSTSARSRRGHTCLDER